MTAHDFYTLLDAARLPPIEGWNPPFCGDSRMRIARDGTWFHEEQRIARPELVRLFAGLLRKEGDDYLLVTPAEKLSIAVEDASFMAVAMTQDGTGLTFTTNVGDGVRLGPGHALRMENGVPYLHVRHGLEAKLARAVWHQLAALAVPRAGELGVWSEGAFFALGPAA
ncbi:MAG: hypothetical protein JWN16_1943 [Alphaproteobacteria bacterium]|nr:hypothetical protein [Alphaproteobacteria bacterium]